MTSPPRKPSPWTLALVLVPLAFFLATTLPSVDFGYHWDEGHGQMDPLRKSLEKGVLLPGHYIYPGVNYWINLSALAPDAFRAWRAGEEMRAALVEAAAGEEARLAARRLRVVLTGLGIVWTFLLLLALRRPAMEALLAASLLAVSWEVVYHSRWPAPDTVMMQFAVLSVLGAVLAVQHRASWAHLAAAGAALACGTKYPGGMLLPFALLALWLRQPRPFPVKPMVRVGATFTVVYLLTTPGTILEFRLFMSFIRYMMKLYSQGREIYEPFAVDSTFDHLGQLSGYLFLDALSPYPAASAALGVFALIGAVQLIRRSPRLAALVVAFPAAYVVYFCRKALFIVRNYQILIPFLAVLAAFGVGEVWRRLPRRWTRGILALGVVALVAFNAAWQIDADRGIRERHEERAVAELMSYIDERPDTRFLLSAKSAASLEQHDGRQRADVVTDAGQGADVVICYLYELGDHFPSNLRPGFIWFGPREVDLVKYAAWRGDDRPLAMPMAMAVEEPLYMPQRIQRRIAFDGGRRDLVTAGTAEWGDRLYAEQAGGDVSFGLEQWGHEEHRWVRASRPLPVKAVEIEPFETVDRSFAVEAGREYRLGVRWDILAGTVEAWIDGEPVFAHQSDLVTARLDQFQVISGRLE